MKKLVALWTNFRLRKISKKFKYGDYLYIETHNAGFYSPSKEIVVIKNVIWKSWFIPITICAEYFGTKYDLFYELKNINKYTVFSGKIRPKFVFNQIVTMDKQQFKIHAVAPMIRINPFTEVKELTFKYMCVNINNTNHVMTESEENLEHMINTSSIWEGINGL